MGVINNQIRIAGIEANIAGVMSSVANCVEAVAYVQSSVRSMKLDLEGLSTSVAGKADKVASATNGDFAGLDSNGNLTDSGKKPSDYMLTSTYDSTAAVARAGGIVAYINDTVAEALSASY